MKSDFIKKNLEWKMNEMQDETMLVLETIYDKKEKYNPQAYTPSELYEILKDRLTYDCFEVCIHDLVVKGFIGIWSDGYRFTEYKITSLGKECVEYKKG